MDWQLQMDKVEAICRLIEDEKDYSRELADYLGEMEDAVSNLLDCARNPGIPIDIEETFLFRLLQDILYGMEHQDSVFLLDALRYGLLEAYRCGKDGLQKARRSGRDGLLETDQCGKNGSQEEYQRKKDELRGAGDGREHEQVGL